MGDGAGVAKLANAAVFKTASLQDCGFKSRRPHATFYPNGLRNDEIPVTASNSTATNPTAPTGAVADWGAVGPATVLWSPVGEGFDPPALHHFVFACLRTNDGP
jgi:hypothetical protein